MGLKTFISDIATGKVAKVLPDVEQLVSMQTYPPLLPQKSIIFRQYLTDDGKADGTSSMLIAAADAPKDFYITADNEKDIYITAINFVIADEGASLDDFGAITALTNGCILKYDYSGGEVIINGLLKTNWDFMRMTLFESPIAEIKVQKDIEGKIDAYAPAMNLTKILPPYGIKLDRGSKERLTITIRDQTNQIDAFNCIAYGFERFE